MRASTKPRAHAVGLSQLSEHLFDPLHGLLDQLGQQPRRHRLHRHQQDGLDACIPIGVFHWTKPSSLVVVDVVARRRRPRPLAAPASPSAASQMMERSPKVVPCPRVTRPILHSSSRARKRTMTWIQVPAPVTRAAEQHGTPRFGQGGDQLGHGLGHRDGVHGQCEVDPGHRPLGRAAQVAYAVLGVIPRRSGACPTKSSSSPTSTWDGARRLFGQGDEDVGRGGIQRHSRRRASSRSRSSHPTRSSSSIRLGPGSDLWLRRTATNPSTSRSGMSRTSTSWSATAGRSDLEDRCGDRVGHPPTLSTRGTSPRTPSSAGGTCRCALPWRPMERALSGSRRPGT